MLGMPDMPDGSARTFTRAAGELPRASVFGLADRHAQPWSGRHPGSVPPPCFLWPLHLGCGGGPTTLAVARGVVLPPISAEARPSRRPRRPPWMKTRPRVRRGASCPRASIVGSHAGGAARGEARITCSPGGLAGTAVPGALDRTLGRDRRASRGCGGLSQTDGSSLPLTIKGHAVDELTST